MDFMQGFLIGFLILLVIIVIFLIVILIKVSNSKSNERLLRLEDAVNHYFSALSDIRDSLSTLGLEFENKLLKGVSSDLSHTKDIVVNNLSSLKEEVLKAKSELENINASSVSETKNRLSQLETKVNKTIAEVNESLTTTVRDVHKTFIDQTSGLSSKIGAMTEKIENLEKMSSEIKKLQDILKPPKQRGIFGEVLLENMLRDTLPQDRFSTQFAIGKDKVDAVIFLGEKILPIDAKFPLDKFEDYLKGNARQFISGVKKMIDSISGKYIKVSSSQGSTTNFAFMYIPSESVWYSLFVENLELYKYAVQKRVFPVSPNTLYSYLHVISEGLNAFEIEDRVEEVLERIISLQNEVKNSLKTFETLRNHLANALNKTDETIEFLNKISHSIDKFKGL